MKVWEIIRRNSTVIKIIWRKLAAINILHKNWIDQDITRKIEKMRIILIDCRVFWIDILFDNI
jgi:hypothetical protein